MPETNCGNSIRPKKYQLFALLIFLINLLTGCATLITRGSDTNYSPVVFPSTRGNFIAIDKCLNGNHSGGFSGVVCIPAFFSPIDLPLALVTDTLMLPVDGHRSYTQSQNQKFWETVFAKNTVEISAEEYANHTEWVKEYIKNKIVFDHRGNVSSELIELIYKIRPQIVSFADIAHHPNLSPKLLDYIAIECGDSCFSQIAEHPKTSKETLERMYVTTQYFHVRGRIADNPNAPQSLVDDFTGEALKDTNKQNTYWAVSNIDRMSPVLLNELSKNPDPNMRLSVAANYYTPVKTIRELQKDTDKLVREKAGDNLRLRKGYHKERMKKFGTLLEIDSNPE